MVEEGAMVVAVTHRAVVAILGELVEDIEEVEEAVEDEALRHILWEILGPMHQHHL